MNKTDKNEFPGLIGLPDLKYILSMILKHKEAYRRGLKLPNLLLPLASKDGHTFISEYLTDFFDENDLRTFTAKEKFLEYNIVDGTVEEVQELFDNITSMIACSNTYEGVVSIDVTAFTKQPFTEKPMQLFLKKLRELDKTATIILFVDPSKKKATVFLHKLASLVGVELLFINAQYDASDYFEMVITHLNEAGIEIENRIEQYLFLMEILEQRVKNATEAIELADKLLLVTDFSKQPPIIKYQKALEFFKNFENITEDKEEA